MRQERFILLINWFILIAISTACVREEIVPYEGGNSQIVVLGFLTPGNKIEVYVGLSQPLGKQPYEAVNFAIDEVKVTLRNEDGNSQVLKAKSNNPSIFSCSQTDFPVQANKTYSITVISPNGTATASTTVPAKAAVWESVRLEKYDNYGYYLFKGSWKKPETYLMRNYGVSLITNRKILEERTNEGINELEQEFSVNREVYLPEDLKIEAVLLTRDEAFAEFSISSEQKLDVLESLQNSGFSGILSSFKGVLPRSGNINGGTGVFGSYLKHIRTVYKE